MGHEVDLVAVDAGERSGDAIALRFGNLYGERSEQRVVVVDGGFKESGEKLVSLINRYYGTNEVDLVISTHPDDDHVSGLSVVLEKMIVKELWMHKPWEHTDDMAELFKDGRVTDSSIGERLQRSLNSAKELEEIAGKKGILIVEPFTGLTDSTSVVTVVGPTKEYYEQLLLDFRATPESKFSFLERTIEAGKGLVARIAESLHIETLTDEGETSAENNSSVILMVQIDNKKLLFTGDAGIPALTLAANILEANGIATTDWSFIKVPHHGSKHNVGPTILNKLLGSKLPEDVKIKTAFASVSKDGAPKHPSKKVTNAFRRRGAPVYVTLGQNIWHHHDTPDRKNYSSITPLQIYDEVEE